MQPGSILVFAEIYLQGKLTILLRDLQTVVVLQGKQGVHEPHIGVYVRDGKSVGRELQYPVPYAYKLIRQRNEELAKTGCITISGRIDRKFFHEKFYGTRTETARKGE